MVNSISGSSYVTSPYAYAPAQSATVSAYPSHSVSAYSSDAFIASNQTGASDTLDPNKQASGMKRMMNGLGNAFGRMADWVGLGTISHYAKENMQAYDANKTNSLDTQEFTAVSSLIAKSFQEVDSNANQEISFGEFKRIVGDIVDANFKALDTSQDGFVNYNEAFAGGYVVNQGNQDSFRNHDKNQDGLLTRNEFAGLLNDMKLKRR